MTKNTSSRDRWIGKSVIYGKDKEHATPYMTRYFIGRLRLHIFHRPDQDPDCHDHPWGFWTFPLTSYIEEVAVVEKISTRDGVKHIGPADMRYEHNGVRTRRQAVWAFQWTYRPATHCHRVLGRWSGMGEETDAFYPDLNPVPGPIITIVWREAAKREWGFLKLRDGRWCWEPAKSYVFGKGKFTPCDE
jgi:hypothetical protein